MSHQSALDAQQIRRLIIEMLVQAQSGHAGGPLGLADLYAVLYREVLKHSPQHPLWEERDRVVVSNGHTSPVLYAALAVHGYFPWSNLQTFRQINSKLQGHPHELPQWGIEITSGPLGQGLSQAVGMALAARLKQETHHIFTVLSDGEHQEGQTWEAYMAGAKYELKNLTTLIDRNFIQITGVTEQIMPLESLPTKLRSFGWQVYEVEGHDHEALERMLKIARDDGLPSAVVIYTEPGHGVDFMEAKYSWHGKPPTPAEAKLALKQINSLQGKLETQHD